MLANTLTRREEQVLAGLVRRLSAVEIGAELGISPTTVHYHKGRLFRSLRVTGREDAILWAVAQGWATAGREWLRPPRGGPEESCAAAGRRGGRKRAEALGPAGFSELGKQGGAETKRRHGAEHFRKIGAKGGQARQRQGEQP